MQKFQWYIISGVSFLFILFFGTMAANRRKICTEAVEVLRQVCMERRTTYVFIGVIFLVISIAFLIAGLFQKK